MFPRLGPDKNEKCVGQPDNVKPAPQDSGSGDSGPGASDFSGCCSHHGGIEGGSGAGYQFFESGQLVCKNGLSPTCGIKSPDQSRKVVKNSEETSQNKISGDENKILSEEAGNPVLSILNAIETQFGPVSQQGQVSLQELFGPDPTPGSGEISMYPLHIFDSVDGILNAIHKKDYGELDKNLTVFITSVDLAMQKISPDWSHRLWDHIEEVSLEDSSSDIAILIMAYVLWYTNFVRAQQEDADELYDEFPEEIIQEMTYSGLRNAILTCAKQDFYPAFLKGFAEGDLSNIPPWSLAILSRLRYFYQILLTAGKGEEGEEASYASISYPPEEISMVFSELQIGILLENDLLTKSTNRGGEIEYTITEYAITIGKIMHEKTESIRETRSPTQLN